MGLLATTSENAAPGRLRTALRSGPFRVLFATVLVGAGMEAWHNHLNAAPTVAIPASTPMPVPNAYDDFARIAARNIEPSSELWKSNRIETLRPAGSVAISVGLPGVPPGSHLPTNMPTVVRANTDDDRRAALAKVAPTLSAFHAALDAHRPFRQPVRRTLDDRDEPLSKFRSLARTLQFEARMREHAGDYAGAVSEGIDGIEFGALVPTGGGMAAHVYGSLIEKIGRKRLWGIVGHLNAEQATVAAHRLEAIAASRQSLSDSLTVEKGIALSQMSDLMHKNTTSGLYHSLRTYDPEDATQNSGVEGLFIPFINAPFNNDASRIETPEEQRTVLHAMSRDGWELMTHSKTQIADDTARIMDIRIAEAKSPFAATSTVTFETHDPFNRSFLYGNSSDSSDTRTLLSALNPSSTSKDNYFRSALLDDAETRMEDSMLILAFALRAYRLHNSTAPDTLDRLVETGLLHQLPADPFATTAGPGLHYRRIDADHFLLYSVGPDGIDNGGQPIALRMRADYDLDDVGDGINPMDKDCGGPEPRYVPDAKDKGDWVFGLNNVPRANSASRPADLRAAIGYQK